MLESVLGLRKREDGALLVSLVGCRDELDRIGAIHRQGKWVLPPEKYMCDLADMTVPTILSKGWSICDFPSDDLVGCLANEDGYPPEATRKFLADFALPLSDPEASSSSRQNQRYTLDKRAICREKARQLLLDWSPWPLEEFVRKWEEMLPDDLDISVRAMIERLYREGKGAHPH